MLPMEVGCSMVGWACLTLRLAASAFAFPYATLKIILCSSLCCLSDCWFLDFTHWKMPESEAWPKFITVAGFLLLQVPCASRCLMRIGWGLLH